MLFSIFLSNKKNIVYKTHLPIRRYQAIMPVFGRLKIAYMRGCWLVYVRYILPCGV